MGRHVSLWVGIACCVLMLAGPAPSAFAQDSEQAEVPPPEEMRAELEFSTPAGHFEMREYPAASVAIKAVPARVAAQVEIFVANRDPQFGSTVGFWVFDENYTRSIRLMLHDQDGELRGDIELLWGYGRSVGLASFNSRLRARSVTDVVITRPEADRIAFTVGNRTRTFDIDFTPAHVVFQAVGVDGFVTFTDPPT